jgi:starvation-inducible DNA-binding protein
MPNKNTDRAETTNIGLSAEVENEVIKLLNAALANYYILAVKVKNYHWNVVGPSFMEHHRFFEGIYDDLSDDIDAIAERVRTLGGRPLGNSASFLREATLNEETRVGLSPQDMLKTLLEDQETLIRQLRDAVDKSDKLGDAGTADFFTNLLTDREKAAWFNRAYVQ